MGEPGVVCLPRNWIRQTLARSTNPWSGRPYSKPNRSNPPPPSRHPFAAPSRRVIVVSGPISRPIRGFGSCNADFACRNPGEADDTGMRLTHDDCPLTEVLVKRNQNPLVVASLPQDFTVAGIGLPVTDPDHVVALRLQDPDRATPYASIQEHPHAGTQAALGSTRSWPTMRWA